MSAQPAELKPTAVVIFLLTILLIPIHTALAEMTIHFIDVGQGGGVFIQKDDKAILYDCGDTSAGPVVTNYLKGLSVKKIDILVVSHAHKDHMGGCIHVLKKFKVGTLYHNGSNAKTEVWRNFLKEVDRAKKVVVVDRDTNIDGMEILVAYDSRGSRYSKEADNSILLRLVDGQIHALLTGDCEAPCEKEVSDTSNVQSEILNVGHHGSEYSSSTEFLNKVKPDIAVIQAGVGNRWKHPKPEVLQRLKQVGATIYETDLQGGIIVHSNGQSYEVQTDE